MVECHIRQSRSVKRALHLIPESVTSSNSHYAVSLVRAVISSHFTLTTNLGRFPIHTSDGRCSFNPSLLPTAISEIMNPESAAMTPARSNIAATNTSYTAPADFRSRSLLLDLPRELRDEIYDYALHISVTETLARSAAQEPPLRNTCRQIRLETEHRYHHLLTAELQQTNDDIKRVVSAIKRFNDQLWQAQRDEANGMAGAESRLNSLIEQLPSTEALVLVQEKNRTRRKLLQRMNARVVALRRTLDREVTDRRHRVRMEHLMTETETGGV